MYVITVNVSYFVRSQTNCCLLPGEGNGNRNMQTETGLFYCNICCACKCEFCTKDIPSHCTECITPSNLVVWRNNVQSPFCQKMALQMKVLQILRMSVNITKTIWRHITEDYSLRNFLVTVVICEDDNEVTLM